MRLLLLLACAGCAIVPSEKAKQVVLVEAGVQPDGCDDIGHVSARASSPEAAEVELREKAAKRGANRVVVTDRSTQIETRTSNGIIGGHAIGAEAREVTFTMLRGALYRCAP